jgi:SAM-dependent methyltransferase
MTASRDGYIFSQEWQDERDRLGALSVQFDPVTLRHLAAAGVEPGWRCLELGAGTGSVAGWLAGAVGPGGRVLATDLDTRFLRGLPDPPVEVRRHDLTTDPLEDAAFDLIHARAVLEHLPNRADLVKRLVPALRPGGVMLLEDTVFGPPLAAVTRGFAQPAGLAPLILRVFEAVSSGIAAVGGDVVGFGLELPAVMTAAGLVDVDAEFTARLIRGGSLEAAFYELSLRQLGDRLVAAGLLAERDVTAMLDAVRDPASQWLSLGLVSAWGRAPSLRL